MTKLCNTAGTF